jgi:hypothetical protein
LYGPADSGKTALFAALKQCFLGISSRLNRQDGGYCHVQYSREALTRRADRPNEALAELQVVRLAYALWRRAVDKHDCALWTALI